LFIHLNNPLLGFQAQFHPRKLLKTVDIDEKSNRQIDESIEIKFNLFKEVLSQIRKDEMNCINESFYFKRSRDFKAVHREHCLRI
jgi:uncharacterized protein YciU (UPF0263 family)